MSDGERILRGGALFLVAASVASAIGGLPFNTLPILLGAYADQLQLGPTQIGTLGSACTGGYLASTLLGPLWVERVPWRPATAVAVAGTAAALLWAGASPSPALPLAAFGFAAGLMHSLGMRIVGEVANKERAFGVRLLTELLLVATILLFLPIVLASHALTGGATLLAAAVAAMGLSGFLIPKGPAAAEPGVAAIEEVSGGKSAGAGWIALAIFVAFACGQVALWVFVERIGRSIDATATQLGLVFSVLKIVGGLSAALVAMLGERLGNRLPHVLVLVALALGVAMLAARPSFAVYALGAWVWEAAFTIGCVYQTAAIAKLDTSNRLVVLVPAAFAVSAFVGPELAGRLAETGGFAPLFWLSVGCAVVPVVAYGLFARHMPGR